METTPAVLVAFLKEDLSHATARGPAVGPMPIVWGPVTIPHALDGLTLRLQAFGLTPTAANGAFAATRARDLEFLN